MKAATKKQMQELDQKAIKDYGIPSILLMDKAASRVYEYIMETPYQSIVIVAGTGNNGGDGFALARQLFLWSSKKVKMVLVGDKEKLSQDCAIFYHICKELGVPIIEMSTEDTDIKDSLEGCEVIVDALFGTGLSKEISGIAKEIIAYCNTIKAHRVSIDIPSGIACDTGSVMGVAFKADVTITFEFLKIGLCLYPGYMYTGKVRIVDIGIPELLKSQFVNAYEILDEKFFSNNLPKRLPRSNKGSYGRVLLIGGQKSMAGAITMAAQASIKVGVGVVSIAVPECIYPIVEAGLWEAMTIGFQDDEGKWSKEGVQQLKTILTGYDAIAVGPGIGRTPVVSELIGELLATDKPCIIDADGIYGLKPHLDQLKSRRAMTILTPHPGELGYLMDKSIEAIMDNSIEIATQFVKDSNVTLVLKTERTVIANRQHIGINQVGNTGLAKGGSGDVLTGMMLGFLGQMLDESAFKIASLAVYGHGRAAEIVAEEKSVYSMTPTDLYVGIEKLFIT